MEKEIAGEPAAKAGGPQNAPEHQVVAEAAKLALNLVHKLGRLTLTNVTTVFALGVLVLYLIGVVRRIAQLHDVGVSTSRGVPLAPLQDYLVSGLGVIVNPATLGLLFIVVFVTVVILAAPKAAEMFREAVERVLASYGTGDEPPDDGRADEPDEPNPGKGSRLSPRASRILRAVASVGGGVAVWGSIVACVLVVPWRYWVAFAAVAAIAAVLLALNRRYAVVPVSKPTSWERHHARVMASTFLGLTLIFGLLVAVMMPRPLDRVVVRPLKGKTITGPLLAQANGAIYVADARRDSRTQASVTAIPLGRIQSFHVEDGPLPHYKTLPEMVGVRFWRVNEDGDLVRSTRPNRPLWEQILDGR